MSGILRALLGLILKKVLKKVGFILLLAIVTFLIIGGLSDAVLSVGRNEGNVKISDLGFQGDQAELENAYQNAALAVVQPYRDYYQQEEGYAPNFGVMMAIEMVRDIERNEGVQSSPGRMAGLLKPEFKYGRYVITYYHREEVPPGPDGTGGGTIEWTTEEPIELIEEVITGDARYVHEYEIRSQGYYSGSVYQRDIPVLKIVQSQVDKTRVYAVMAGEGITDLPDQELTYLYGQMLMGSEDLDLSLLYGEGYFPMASGAVFSGGVSGRVVKMTEENYDVPFAEYFGNPGGMRISSPYGWRIHPIKRTRSFHTGLDFPMPRGTPVLAVKDGVVHKVVRLHNIFGSYVILDHGEGWATFYAHLDSFTVKEGATVKRGEQIGAVGNTGLSTGPHLHFEVRENGRACNPVY